MSRVDIKVQISLLKEAKSYFDNVKQKDTVVLTQEHILEWLEVFYDDRIKMDTCNEATVRR
ncbi:hypothetical protein LCX93_02810 [Sulfurimonas sp. SWIR-19]|uniref:hypothetical protein n=1 Tax=Sulfurimonas sp. SWIR-19 TaxID=2878390 RepID=UPI001CF4E08C|nr:hypothetical protein [Sulfurimonas sp. SWIR-19]UCN00864.1 hypothetical protein LCX93_02810 [Sulfurimonas sp. SWIR-19]